MEEQIFGPLRLDADESRESDEVRDFLSKHCNLEGKTGRKSWATVRMVWDNFSLMFVSHANAHNERNKDRIIAAENLTAEMNAANTGNGSLPQRDLSEDEVWQDGEAEFEEFERGATKYVSNGDSAGNKKARKKVSHYEIGRADLRDLIRWKRHMKTQGGIKAVRPRTREEILGPLKKNNPKKQK